MAFSPYLTIFVCIFWQCKASDRLANMTNLVYWYGAYDNLEGAFSFLPTSKLIAFDVGKKRVGKKLESLGRKSRLSNSDELLQKGVLEMEEDLKKEPSERFGNLETEFLEEYEHLVFSSDELALRRVDCDETVEVGWNE